MIRLITIFVLAATVTTASFACRCRPPSQTEAFAHAQAVVFGEITSVKDIDEARTVLRVNVVRSWKQSMSGQIEVDTGTTCRLVAHQGEHYLLYLRKDNTGHYFTTHCMGDRLDPQSIALDEVTSLASDLPHRSGRH